MLVLYELAAGALRLELNPFWHREYELLGDKLQQWLENDWLICICSPDGSARNPRSAPLLYKQRLQLDPVLTGGRDILLLAPSDINAEFMHQLWYWSRPDLLLRSQKPVELLRALAPLFESGKAPELWDQGDLYTLSGDFIWVENSFRLKIYSGQLPELGQKRSLRREPFWPRVLNVLSRILRA